MISINEEMSQKNSKIKLKRRARKKNKKIRARMKGPLANWEDMERLKTGEEM